MLHRGHGMCLVLCIWLLLLLLVQATADELEHDTLDTLDQPDNQTGNSGVHNVTRPTVVTFGDSLTKYGYGVDGWVTLLKEDYPNLRFLDKGRHMGKSRQAPGMVMRLTTDSKLSQRLDLIKLVTLWYGANDVNSLPVEEFSQNLRGSIRILQNAGVTDVLLMTPPPQGPQRGVEVVKELRQYADAVKSIGAENGLPVVDIFQHFISVTDWLTMLPDGLHLSAQGQQLVYSVMKDALHTHYKALHSWQDQS